MKLIKLIRDAIASIWIVTFIYLFSTFRGDVEPDLNDLLYYLMIWAPFLFLVFLVAPYYSKAVEEEKAKKLAKINELKKQKKLKRMKKRKRKS